MRRSARSPEPESGFGELLREGLVLTGGAVARSPLLVGGTTAFLVTMGFVAANALWYQPYFHKGAFFETRSVIRLVPEDKLTPQPTVRPEPVPVRTTTITPQRPAQETLAQESAATRQVPMPASAARPNADATVEQVQQRLADLNLYAGQVDGLAGPQTNGAIDHYRKIVGLEAGLGIDADLLQQLGISGPAQAASVRPEPDVTASIANAPIPQPREQATRPAPAQAQPPAAVPAPAPAAQPAVQTAAADPRILRIQAALRAFGNDGIDLDGRVGKRTRDALKEFQALFGLPETGEADERTYVKMREIGLTD